MIPSRLARAILLRSLTNFLPRSDAAAHGGRRGRFLGPLLAALVLVLGLLQPAGPVGVFGVARRLSMLVGSLLTSISVLFNPMVADLHHKRHHTELDRLFNVYRELGGVESMAIGPDGNLWFTEPGTGRVRPRWRPHHGS